MSDLELLDFTLPLQLRLRQKIDQHAETITRLRHDLSYLRGQRRYLVRRIGELERSREMWKRRARAAEWHPRPGPPKER